MLKVIAETIKRSAVARAFLTVGGFTLLVQVVATLQHLAIANIFGTRDAVDAFLVAWVIPGFAFNVIGGALNSSFLPTFVEVLEIKGTSAARQLLANITVVYTGICSLFSFALLLSSGHILDLLGSGFNSPKLLLTQRLFYVLLPIIFFKGLSSLWMSILNAKNRFAWAAVAPIFTPALSILSMVWFAGRVGIYSLVWGMTTGALIEAGAMAQSLRQLGFSPLPRWHGVDDGSRQVMQQFIPMAAGAMIMGSSDLVDRSMAAMLPPGSVSALNYGNKVVAFIIGIGVFGLSTAIFPHFSRLATQRDWKRIRETLKRYALVIGMVSVPCTMLLFYFSTPLVRLLFERGAFQAHDSLLVGRIQAFYILQIPFYVLNILIVRMISSLKGNIILMWGAVINLAVNIFGNLVYMKIFGVAGIALSTSCVYLVSCLFLGAALQLLIRKNARTAVFEDGQDRNGV